MKTIHKIAVKQIAPPRAEEWKGETGIKLDLVIGSHNEDAGYWTNNVFEVFQDFQEWKKGDKVIINYQVVAEAFGSYAARKGEDVGEVIDGVNVYFFPPSEILVTMRGGTLIAPKGRCLVTRIKKAPATSLFLLADQAKEEYERDLYRVEAVGAETEESKLHYETTRMTFRVLTEAVPNVGDVVVVMKHAGYPIEAPLKATLGKEYWIMLLSDIMGTYDGLLYSEEEHRKQTILGNEENN